MHNRVTKNAIEDTTPLKIGTMLVKEGFIRKADLAQAIDIQQQEARHAELPLGKLLVKQKLIDRRELQTLLEHPELVREIETYALESGRIDARQLARCIQEKPAGQPLPEALVAAGYLNDEDLKVFFEHQLDSLKICELAVQTGLVSETDINEVLQLKKPPRAIGEILCELNLITPLDLNAVLTKYRKHLRLGEILLKHGLIDKPTFDWVLQLHERRGEPLGSILRREALLSEEQLFSAFSLQYNIPFEKPDDFKYSADQREALTQIVGKAFSDQFHVLPLRLEESTLTVAVSDPADLKIVNSLRSKRVDLRTHCVLVTPSALKRLYCDLYGVTPKTLIPEKVVPPTPQAETPREMMPPELSPPAPIEPDIRHPRDDEALKEVDIQFPQTNEAPEEADVPGPQADETPKETDIPASQWVHQILSQAISSGAQAIHFDQDLRTTVLRFRIGDTLRKPSEPWPEADFQQMAPRIMDSIREIAGMDTEDRHRPQEGMFRAGMADTTSGAEYMDFSVTSCPTLAGESMTIKRIYACSPAPGMEDLPHSPHVVSSLKQALSHMSGMFLVATPNTNSRSAALYGMLRQLQQPDLKAVTVEETVSLSMPEAIQIQTNPSAEISYATMLRTALHLDPDVILAGNLADPESAALALEAARKGVLLLGGIHASDAVEAISCLETLGIPVPQVASHVSAILAQRYVRKICPDCRQTYRPSPEEWQSLFERFPGSLTFHRGAGCPECGFSGYRGKILLSELLVISDPIARAVKRNMPGNDIRQLIVRSGIKNLIDDGLSKLDQTTLSEIIDAIPPEAAKAYKCLRADTEGDRKEGGYRIVLTAPDLQKTDIRQLHTAYEVLMEEAGRQRRRSDPGLFETFIRAHHDAACRRYGCSRVAFFVTRQGKQVVLLAKPILF